MENLIFYEFVCNELIIVIIKLCAIIQLIKGNRHRVVDLGYERRPSLSRQSTGKVFCYFSDKSSK